MRVLARPSRGAISASFSDTARFSALRSVSSTLVFFLTWFPTYLATERQMEFLKVGFYAVMPFIAASIGVMCGGWISDTIIKKTGSATLGRKLPILTGLLLASTIVGANYVG